MLPLYIALVISLVGIVPLRALYKYRGSRWDDGPTFFIGVILAIIITILALVAGYTDIARHYGRTSCYSWGVQSGHPAKYIITTRFDTGSCLTKEPNGLWSNK